MTDDREPSRTGFWIAFAVGWLVIAFGIVQLLDAPDGLAGAAKISGWVAGGHVVHDALVAPLALAVGAAIAAIVAPRLRAPVRAGLLASACVVAVVYPALRGYGRKPNNPSVLPLDYASAVLTVLAVIWVIVALWMVAASIRAHRVRRIPAADQAVGSGVGSGSTPIARRLSGDQPASSP